VPATPILFCSHVVEMGGAEIVLTDLLAAIDRDRFAQVAHQLLIVVQVVNRRELGAEDFRGEIKGAGAQAVGTRTARDGD
jgi:hypothetical protein